MNWTALGRSATKKKTKYVSPVYLVTRDAHKVLLVFSDIFMPAPDSGFMKKSKHVACLK